jgi:hypothetical protein
MLVAAAAQHQLSCITKVTEPDPGDTAAVPPAGTLATAPGASPPEEIGIFPETSELGSGTLDSSPTFLVATMPKSNPGSENGSTGATMVKTIARPSVRSHVHGRQLTTDNWQPQTTSDPNDARIIVNSRSFTTDSGSRTSLADFGRASVAFQLLLERGFGVVLDGFATAEQLWQRSRNGRSAQNAYSRVEESRVA